MSSPVAHITLTVSLRQFDDEGNPSPLTADVSDAALIIVPDAWLRRIPRQALSARAEVAARIATAHRTATIEHRLRQELQLALPF